MAMTSTCQKPPRGWNDEQGYGQQGGQASEQSYVR